MSQLTLDAASTPQKANFADFYRAVWRWHFYAGLLVLPFLITLSITGGLYLFRYPIDKAFHSTLKQVEAPAGAKYVGAQTMVDAALSAYPGTAQKIIMPMERDLSAEITVAGKDGKLAVYVNPYNGKVLGALSDRSTLMWTVRYLHSLRYFGPTVRAIIEIAGGWMLILVGTGLYLWWPRKSNTAPAFAVRGAPKQRVFWRDLHAILGVSLSVIIAFLVITGMPWSGNWGAKVNQWANGTNFGYPAGIRVDVPMSDEHVNHSAPTTWSLEQAKTPQSTAPAQATPIGLSKAVEIFETMGLVPGFTVTIPSKPSGVYTGSVYPSDLAKQRVVHLDQYSGKPLIDMSYADYGPLGKWMEFGINVHMGQQWGLLNQLVLVAACLGMIMLSVSAAVMWWKRRPSRQLGVPPMPADGRAFKGILAIIIIGGILFPLTGLSFLAMLLFDFVFFSRKTA